MKKDLHFTFENPNTPERFREILKEILIEKLQQSVILKTRP